MRIRWRAEAELSQFCASHSRGGCILLCLSLVRAVPRHESVIKFENPEWDVSLETAWKAIEVRPSAIEGTRALERAGRKTNFPF